MSAVSEAWSTQSFRSAIHAMLEIDDHALRSLDDLLQTDVQSSMVEATRRLEGVEAAPIMAALHFLYRYKDAAGGPEETVRELESLVSSLPEQFEDVDFESRRDAITYLLRPRPELERSIRFERAQAAVFPVLLDAFATVDLRPAPAEDEDEDEPDKYVPVVVMRFEFDEPIHGSSALSFQLADDGLAALEEALLSVRSRRERIQHEFGDRLL